MGTWVREAKVSLRTTLPATSAVRQASSPALQAVLLGRIEVAEVQSDPVWMPSQPSTPSARQARLAWCLQYH